MTLYAADTDQEALSTDTDHLYDPANSTHGCGGRFSHSDMSRYSLPLTGHWMATTGSALTISDDRWVSVASWGISTYTIEFFTPSLVVMQNSPTASYNAGKWSKVEYHTNADGSIGYVS